MVASRHPSLSLSSLLLLLLLLQLWTPTHCQMGFRTLPLTGGFRNRSSSLGLFSKWTGGGSSVPSMNAPSIENELAAIFRGVAYGVTTEPTTTSSTTSSTTTTTTTTTLPATTAHKILTARNDDDSSGSIYSGTLPNGKEISDRNGAKPFVESPVIEAETGVSDEDDFYDSFSEDIPPSVVRADVGISDIPWIAKLGPFWQIHVYTVASLFSLIALMSLYCLARIHLATQLLPRGYYITVHLLVFLAAFFRCVIFFHDPYAAGQRLPSGLSNVLFNTGTPCIITALAVLVLALLRAARLNILPLNLQSPIAVAVISGALVVGNVIVDVLGSIIKDRQLASGLRAGIQALTAGWGAALCVGYIIIFSRIVSAANRQQNEMIRLSFSRFHIDGASLPQRFPKCSLNHGARATIVASISGLLLAILQVYGLMNTDGIINIPPRQPWVWFGYQTACRFLEILMWTCVCIASALPAALSKNTRTQNGMDDGQLLTVFSCNGCCTSCSYITTCCITDKKSSDDMYSTFCQSNHIARPYPHHTDAKPIPQDTIAATTIPSKQISTTLLPPKGRKSLRKSATLHSGNSDVQLLWNNNSNANSSNSSSRPSSLILTEGGLIKFRTHDPHSETIKIVNYLKHDPDNQAELQETQNKIFQNCSGSEDNYINKAALSPEEKRILERSIKSGNFQILIENGMRSDNYPAGMQKKNSFRSEGNIKRNCNFSPAHDCNKFANTCSANSFDIHVYEDGDQLYYQNPSLNSSMDSNGHVYASIQQPVFQGQPVVHQSSQTARELSHEKILNNANFHKHSPISLKANSSSPQIEDVQIDYLTDVSQETMSPQTDKLTCFPESPCNCSKTGEQHCYKDEKGNFHIPVYRSSNPMLINSEQNDKLNNFEISDYIGQNNDDKVSLDGCSTSPQGLGLFNKIMSPSFGNVSYAPLQSEEQSFPELGDKHFPPSHSPDECLRHLGLRPHRVKHSAPSISGPKIFNCISQSCHRELDSRQRSWNDYEMDKANEKQSHLSPSREQLQLKQRTKQESDPQLDFQPLASHKVNSKGVPWTDSKSTFEGSSCTSSQEHSSLEGSNFDLHSQCVDSDEDDFPDKKGVEVRWPSKCKEETGV